VNVTKVKLLIDQALFEECYFKGTIFYVTRPYRKGGRTEDRSDVFDMGGALIGTILGHYFDFGNKDVFEKVAIN
jgi:hypothetical protein